MGGASEEVFEDAGIFPVLVLRCVVCVYHFVATGARADETVGKIAEELARVRVGAVKERVEGARGHEGSGLAVRMAS